MRPLPDPLCSRRGIAALAPRRAARRRPALPSGRAPSSPRRPPVRDPLRRDPFRPRAAGVLAAPPPAVPGDGPQHGLRLPLLELPRMGGGEVRVAGPGRRRGILPDRPGGGPVGAAPARALFLRGMGDGRAALVAAPAGGHRAAHHRPAVPRAGPALPPGGRPGAGAPAGDPGRSDPDGPGRERVRLLRRRSGLPGGAAPGPARRRLRRAALRLQSARRHPPWPAARPLPGGQFRGRACQGLSPRSGATSRRAR